VHLQHYELQETASLLLQQSSYPPVPTSAYRLQDFGLTLSCWVKIGLFFPHFGIYQHLLGSFYCTKRKIADSSQCPSLTNGVKQKKLEEPSQKSPKCSIFSRSSRKTNAHKVPLDQKKAPDSVVWAVKQCWWLREFNVDFTVTQMWFFTIVAQISALKTVGSSPAEHTAYLKHRLMKPCKLVLVDLITFGSNVSGIWIKSVDGKRFLWYFPMLHRFQFQSSLFRSSLWFLNTTRAAAERTNLKQVLCLDCFVLWRITQLGRLPTLNQFTRSLNSGNVAFLSDVTQMSLIWSVRISWVRVFCFFTSQALRWMSSVSAQQLFYGRFKLWFLKWINEQGVCTNRVTYRSFTHLFGQRSPRARSV